eukprot:scaffold4973_cov135-Cylindrotheca_fusiformis.AAC.26
MLCQMSDSYYLSSMLSLYLLRRSIVRPDTINLRGPQHGSVACYVPIHHTGRMPCRNLAEDTFPIEISCIISVIEKFASPLFISMIMRRDDYDIADDDDVACEGVNDEYVMFSFFPLQNELMCRQSSTLAHNL